LTDCGAVISGSDHGVIYVYNRKTGERLDELIIKPGKFFQTVAVSDPFDSNALC
jgi:hypothetical protein